MEAGSLVLRQVADRLQFGVPKIALHGKIVEVAPLTPANIRQARDWLKDAQTDVGFELVVGRRYWFLARHMMAACGDIYMPVRDLDADAHGHAFWAVHRGADHVDCTAEDLPDPCAMTPERLARRKP